MPVGLYAPVTFVGNGVTTVIPYNFKILDQTHIKVAVDGALKTLTTDYTVDGVGNSSGGNITMLVAPALGTSGVVYRDVPYLRTEDYQSGGDFSERTVDKDFDLREMQIQQLKALSDRTPKVASGSVLAGDSFTLPAPGAGQYLRWNLLGTALEAVSAVISSVADFLQSGVGAVLRSFSSKVGERVSIGDFGGGPTKTEAENATAIVLAIAYLRSDVTVNGGIVECPPGTYHIAADVVAIPPNIWLRGSSPTSAYNANQLVGGTTFIFGTGYLGIRQHGDLSRLSNIRLAGAGVCKRGLLTTGVGAKVDHVSASGFEYGMHGANLNTVDWESVQCYGNSKVGFSVLPANSDPAVLATSNYNYLGADLWPLISGTASTNWTVSGRSKFAGNLIGMVIRGGLAATLTGYTFESNLYYGRMIYKEGGGSRCNDITFQDGWQEDDARSLITAPGVHWTISLIEILKTGAASYLHGDISNDWAFATEEWCGNWVGSDVETRTLGNPIPGPVHGLRIINERCNPNGTPWRMRSQFGTVFDSCFHATDTFFSAEPQSDGLVIRNPKGNLSGAASQLGKFTVPGTQVVYDYERTWYGARVDNLANNTDTNVIPDVTALSPHNRYGFIVISDGLAATRSEGWVSYDGTAITIVNIKEGANCSAHIVGNALKYKQTTGGAVTATDYIVRPMGATHLSRA